MNYVVRNKIISCTSQYRSIISQKRWLSDRLLLAKKCLLCLISFLDFILFLKTDPRIGKFLAPAAHRPCWGFAKEGFWSCIHGTLFPGRSAFCQLSLKSWGFPPSHFHLSTCLIFIILSCFSLIVWFRRVYVLML